MTTSKAASLIRDQRRATIVDVAQHANVSHQTVSRYLQHHGAGMKRATIERVEKAIKDLNYHPNLVARSMRTRRSGRITIVMPPLAHHVPMKLLVEASASAHEAGYTVENVSYEGDAHIRCQRVLELAESGQTDGIVSFAPLAGWPDEQGDSLSCAVVIVPTYDDDMHGIGELADGATVKEILQYLASMGHQRFLHVAGDDSWPSARNRRQVYLDSIDELGLHSYGVSDGDWSSESGYDAVASLPDKGGPTAVIAANDIVAMGAIRAALDRGWQVPGDLSVIGWDNHDGLDYAKPSLSTVDVNSGRQGREAMLQLLAILQNEPIPEPARLPLNTLVIRESTGAPA
jgi:LacI family repressor for deo operon, udp, cdd, tsx, nupC, and nupG